MCSEADPDHHSHDGHPVTHHHREHAINDNDRNHFIPNGVAVDIAKQHDDRIAVPDFDHSVTVADLLDAYDKRNHHFVLAFQGADDSTVESFRRIRRAVKNYRALSPEERAEFDRRTT